MRVRCYVAGDRRYLAIDAERSVPDRAAFAARLCDPATGVAPPDGEGSGLVHADQGVAGPRGGPGVAADAPGPASAAARGADGVLFLALEPDFRPPRVVMTVVHPEGDRSPCCTEGVRCAGRWAAARTDAGRAMVDTQAGTRAARVHADGSVSVEGAGDADADDRRMERGQVVEAFTTDVERPRP